MIDNLINKTFVTFVERFRSVGRMIIKKRILFQFYKSYVASEAMVMIKS